MSDTHNERLSGRSDFLIEDRVEGQLKVFFRTQRILMHDKAGKVWGTQAY